ncbi:carboxypeptidase-like regulatory domain-containing protein [Hymenobacter gummosus]|uniref:carboxypeptidase-like regulatory domain-containing protein n=1 Tax=Hymenobacter gummosus TaxID=1776032 RepID=UPI0014053ABB|nr:carboxypeptidase-like regulatory domain-containing protein [Hymenobacter gummosus]
MLLPRFLLLSAALLPALLTTAQQLSGRVTVAGTQQPVPFATVGVQGQPLGSTADETGRFAFATPATLLPTDSVIISCIGYRARRLTVAQVQAETTWPLTPVAQALAEVPVRHGRLTPAVLGRRETGGVAHWTTKLRDTTPVATDERGWEIATVLPVRHSCYLDAFHLYLEQNGFGPVRLRFTLYAVENGLPTRQLLTRDIQFTVPPQQTGWATLDLSSYNIHLPKGQTVAAGIQWLQGQKLPSATEALGGPGAYPSLGHRVALRDKSEAPWRLLPVNVSMYLAVQQYQ